MSNVTLDKEMALGYCGGKESIYKTVLGMFIKLKDNKQRQMNDALAAGDYKNYTVLIHALKSTALNVGSTELSAAAKALELAGKRYQAEGATDSERAAEVDYIRANHPQAMALYDSVAATAEHTLTTI